MAQIIKHRRGSLEALSAVTASLSKGEIIIASGSSNLSVNNGSSIVFAVPENGQVQAVNRFLIGDNAPNVFSAGTYNGMLKGVPYYASGSSTLYLLGEGSNDIPNLVGNISVFSQSVDSRLDAVEAQVGGGGGGSLSSRVAGLESFTGSYATTGSNTFVGNQTISASLSVSGTVNFNNAVAVNDANMNLTNSSSLNLTSGSSIYVNGPGIISGSISGIGNVTAFSQSVDSRLDILEGTFSTSVDSRLDRIEESTSSINSYTASLKTAISLSGQNVTIAGNLIVQGTQTQVDSTTIQLGDNIIELNGSGAANGGLIVKDPTAPNTISGSLLWDSTNDYWKAGQVGSEQKILLANGDSVVSGSSQITITSTTGYSTFSSSIATSFSASDARELALSTSVDSRLDSIEASLGGGGSIGTRVSALEAFSGSQEQKDVIISAYTASMNAFTASQLQKDSTLQTYIFSSANPPLTSFTYFTPALIAFAATPLRIVSIETGTPSFTTSSKTGITRANSSSSLTRSAPGLVDSPPISIMSTPSSSILLARDIAASVVKWRPPSANESGVTFKIPITKVRIILL